MTSAPVLPIHRISKIIYDGITYHVRPIWRGDILVTCEELDSLNSPTGMATKFYLPDLLESAQFYDLADQEIRFPQEENS